VPESASGRKERFDELRIADDIRSVGTAQGAWDEYRSRGKIVAQTAGKAAAYCNVRNSLARTPHRYAGTHDAHI